MTRTMRRHQTAWLQPESAEEIETNPSVPKKEEQPNATKGKVLVDYNPDIDYPGLELKNEPDAQEEKEENTDV